MNGRGVRLTAVAAAVAALVAAGTEAAERVLFPAPLHLVRHVEDSLTGKTTTISEFCSGSRITSVVVEGGVIARVSAVDFAAETLLEIDRIAETWSVSTFAEIARAAAPRVQAAGAGQRKWVLHSEGDQAIEKFVAESATPLAKVTVELSIDRRQRLSREAVEAISGAAYPNPRSDLRDLIVNAAAPRRGDSVTALSGVDTDYGLPVREVVTIEAEGERIVTLTTVTSIDDALVPPELLAVPAGARRVPSRLARFAEELQRADGPPPRP